MLTFGPYAPWILRRPFCLTSKIRKTPPLSQRVIPAHFLPYSLKYPNQVRNLTCPNLVTGLKEFTQLLVLSRLHKKYKSHQFQIWASNLSYSMLQDHHFLLLWSKHPLISFNNPLLIFTYEHVWGGGFHKSTQVSEISISFTKTKHISLFIIKFF